MRTVTEYMHALNVAMQGFTESHAGAFTDLIKGAERVFICGNGGSAATASHMACDLAKTTGRCINAIALTDNVPMLTAIGNDVSYQRIFTDQLIPHKITDRDLLIVISASGNSSNVVDAATYARKQKVNVIGLLGFGGGKVRGCVNYLCVMQSDDYGVVEDAHAVAMHILTERLKAL